MTAALVLVFSVTLFAAGGCRQILGLEQREASPCAVFTYAEPECEQCMLDACCDEAAACSGDDVCRGAYDCLAGCAVDDTACRVDCDGLLLETVDSTNPPFATVRDCRAGQCAVACASCGGFFDEFGEACNQCISEECCAEAVACAADPQCVAFFRCVARETAPGEPTACDLDAGPVFAQGAACSFAHCAEECGFGARFECAGRFSWPTNTLNPTTFQYRATFFDAINTTMLIEGADVQACTLFDPTCERSSHDHEVTGADGSVQLTIPIGTSAFEGYLLVRKIGYVDLLVAVAKPLIHDEDLSFPLVATSTLHSLGKEIDPDAGHLFMQAQDCSGAAASGASFEHSAGDGLRYYFAGGTLDFEAEATDSRGLAGFLNVPTGDDTLTMSADGVTVGTRTVVVVPNTITEIFPFYPSPAPR